MYITTLGTGDAFDRESPNSAFHIGTSNGHWLFDCGPTVPSQLWAQGLADEIDVLFISHTHTDHCLGLATIMNYWCSIRRTKPLYLVCQKSQKNTLELLIQLGIQHEQVMPFEVIWETSLSGSILGCRFETALTQHSVPNHSLLLNEALFISGDGKPSLDSLALMNRSNSIIHECEIDADSGNGHSGISELLDKLPHQQQIYLYHFKELNRPQLERDSRYTGFKLLHTGQNIEVNS
ncbi:MBL fold metallo-hydrolase [Vibrio kyushuensis]|uniref:MBL fold metallo-hydrolase n=1 Tax=Vibrio kyushuensis TaxID=2910249 RepID=UPI003D0A6E5D